MYTYSFVQWLAFFYIYCFIGWCIESTIVSVESKKFVNRGFLRITMLPLYGFGALSILFASLPFKDNPTLAYISAALSCTLLEYITGVVMEAIFKVKYWDYSSMKYNLNGKICLTASFFWGFLSLFMTYQLHDFVSKRILKIPDKALQITVLIVSVIFIADVIYSIKSAIDVRMILSELTEIRNQLNVLAKQKLDNLEKSKPLQTKVAKLNQDKQKLLNMLSFYSKHLIKAHPKATSVKFSEALMELKAHIKNKIK